MIPLRHMGAACAVSLSFAAKVATAADFHPITDVTTTMATGNPGGNPLTNIIQGPGTGFSATEPHDQTGGTWYTDAPGGFPSDYINVRPGPEELVFDLGSNVPLSEISYWGYSNTNANGLREFHLHFATEADGTGGFGTTVTANPSFAAIQNVTPRQSFTFPVVTARYVRLTATSTFYNHPGAGAGGDRLGIGEIAFEDATPAVDPQISMADALVLDLDGSVQIFDVPIGNLGTTQTLNLVSISFTGTHQAAFGVNANPGSVPPGGSETLQIAFNPTGISGNVSATLEIQTNDPSNPTTTVDLSGFVHDPNLVVASNLDFGLIAPGSPAQSTDLEASNGGGSLNLNIAGTSVTGADAAHFNVISTPASLAPLAVGNIVVEFDPAGEEGNFFAQLEIASNDPTAATATVNLSARVADLTAESSVRINEFMASNGLTLDDGDGNSSDWIEIHNAGPDSVDITGWHLTDNANDLAKWTFPTRVLLPNEYLIVFASGQDTDDYVDAGGFLHTNFKLTASGEYLALVKGDGTAIVTEFQPAFPSQFNDISYGSFQSGGSTASLIDSSIPELLVPSDGSLGTTWHLNAFTPGAEWFTGTGSGIGYERNSNDYTPYITTDVEAEMDTVHPSIFIRFPFAVTDKSLFTAMRMHVRYDDGFAAYLNGTEIANINAPSLPAWNSVAGGSHEATSSGQTIDVSQFLNALENGNHVLAVHGLNRASSSSDFLVDIELDVDQAGTGPLSFGYLTAATPGSANAGSAIPGPEITNVVHTPSQPTASESIAVSATVRPRLAGVNTVELVYRVDFGTEVTLAMTPSGNDVWTATIPASAYGAGDMVRWFVRATDSGTNLGRAPAFLDQSGNNQSPEYFGTMAADPAVNSQIPAFYWFTQNASSSRTRSGARASVFFRGKFYDNIFVRQRGQATNGNSQKFDFNKGFPADLHDELPSVGEINLNAQGSDSSYIRQPLSFDAFRRSGTPSSISFHIEMRLNGSFDRVGVLIEQVDEDFLKRNDLDENGALYKFVQRSNLRPGLNDVVLGREKKIPSDTDYSDLQSLIDGLKQSLAGTHIENSGSLVYTEPDATNRHRFMFDNLNIPAVIDYMAATVLIQNTDDTRKNFYMYRDTYGTGEWQIFPWDMDFTFGVGESAGGGAKHPFWGDAQHKNPNALQWNILFDAIHNDATTQAMLLRRLRTQMDDQMRTSSGAAGVFLESHAMQMEAMIDSVPGFDVNVGSLLSEINERRQDLYFIRYGPGGSEPLIPAAQTLSLALDFGVIEYNPASANQDQEYIELTNPHNEDLDLSGWTLEDGVAFTFPPGTVVPANGNVYVSPSPSDFRSRTASPTGNEGNFVVGPYSGHLSNFGETLVLKDSAGTVIATTSTPVDPSDPQRFLVVSEIMYHPADPNPDSEFIEVMNISDSVTLDLGGVAFTAGIDYVFPNGTMLQPGERTVVNFADFQNGKRLNNGSDRIKLEDASGSTIREFTYNDNSPWPAAPDGGGPSLVLIAPATNPDHALAENWRQSATHGGNAGASDAIPYAGGDLIGYALPGAPFISPGPLLGFDFRIGADDATITPEWSSDLVTWSADGMARLSATSDGSGTATALWTLPAGQPLFVRLRLTLRTGL